MPESTLERQRRQDGKVIQDTEIFQVRNRIFVMLSINAMIIMPARLYASNLRRGICILRCRASLPLNHCAFDVACHVDDSEETIKK